MRLLCKRTKTLGVNGAFFFFFITAFGDHLTMNVFPHTFCSGGWTKDGVCNGAVFLQPKRVT